MDFSGAKKFIKENHWWSEDCPVKWGYCYWMHAAVDQRQYFHPDYPTAIFLAVKDGYGQEKSSEEEKLEGYKWLKEKFRDDRSFIVQEVERWHQMRDSVQETIAEIIYHDKYWGQSEVAALHKKITARAIDFVRWGYFIECSDVYSTKILPEVVKQELPNLSENDITSLIGTLSTPLLVSFMEEYQIEMSQTAKLFRADIKNIQSESDIEAESSLYKAISAIQKQYKWITVNYGGSPAMTMSVIIDQLQHELEKNDKEIEQGISDVETKIERLAIKQSDLQAKHVMSKDLEDDFQIMRELGVSMDERKETMVKTSFALYKLFTTISELTSVDKQDIEWYLIDEVQALLTKGTKVHAGKLAERRKLSVFMTEFDGEDSSTVKVFSGKEAKQLYSLLNPETTDKVKGIVASAPEKMKNFKGTAQIVLDVTSDSFEKNSILVTSMTRPEFVPLMKKAAAIITDEGGVTCHAAVVSREMGIPCIIGTKNATKILKSDQNIIMDLATGDITVAKQD